MVSLFVRTHWCDEPPTGVIPLQPPPIWASTYPGPVPRQPFDLNPVTTVTSPPPWPALPPGPVPSKLIHHVWFPVVRQGDLDASGWVTGPNWAGSPPPVWDVPSGAPANTADLGYSAGAAGFRVNRVRFYLPANPGTDFTFTVLAPGGLTIGTVPSAQGWSGWLPVPTALADGKGIWSLNIDRASTSSVVSPGLFPTAGGGNAVNEPYVAPYGNEFEGILGVEIDGVEINTPVTITPTASVSVGTCDPAGKRPVSLDITFSPQLTTGWAYTVSWSTTLAPPWPTASGVVSLTPLPSVSATVDYLPGTYYPSATVTLTPPGGPAATTVLAFNSGLGAGVVVAACPAEVCHDLVITSNRPTPCISGSPSSPVTFTATVSPAMPAWTGPISWLVRDPNNQIVALPTPTPTGSTLTTTFTMVGRYSVIASITRAAGCEPATVSTALPVDVTSCDCPSIVGGLTATQVNGCTFNFSAYVVSPATTTPISYTWDFGDGTTSTLPPPLTHTYAAGTNGQRTVALTVTAGPQCADSRTMQVLVDCGSGGNCPTFSGGITAAQVPGSSCSFNLAVTLNNPAGTTSQITWSLPGGGTATGATTTTMLAPGGSGTATATLTSPGCQDQVVSVNLTCPGGGTPPTTTTPSCAILLILALALLLIGGIVTIVGVCTGIVWVIVVGAIIAAIGLILFIIWAIVCAAMTPCSLMRTLHCILFWIVAVVVPFVAVLMLIFASPPCALATIVTGVAWGSIYAWLGRIMRSVGCTPTC